MTNETTQLRTRSHTGVLRLTAVIGALVVSFSSARAAGVQHAIVASHVSPSLPPRTMRAAPSADPTCDTVPGYHVLDFWVGEWDVKVNETLVGTNTIAKVAGGCALIENWRDVTGEEGKSLFYFLRARKEWKQVWVQPGGVKEKRMIARFPTGAIRFQGELPRTDGSFVLDRTTLTPLATGQVRQVIEQSVDGGQNWIVGFDAMYVRRGSR